MWGSGTEFESTPGDGRSRKFAESQLLQIGCLLGGAGESGYNEVCMSTGISGYSHKALYYQFNSFYEAALQVRRESCAIARKIYESSQAFKDVGGYVGLYDGAWLHRGYASQHGSGAMVECSTGMVVFAEHLSKDPSQFGSKWLHSSSAMETDILQQILAQAKDLRVNFKIIVGDADASTQKVVTDSGAACGRCCNHGGKNLGKHAMAIGKIKDCNCPTKLRADGTPTKNGTKDHRNITDAMGKKMQKAFGAVTMSIGTDKALWVRRIEQIVNHYHGDHLIHTVTPADPVDDPTNQGPWQLLDVTNHCTEHDLLELTPVPPPHPPLSFETSITERKFEHFDCPKMHEDLKSYMASNLTCDVDEFVTDVGGCRTNMVETLWKSSLKFRSKDTNIGGDEFKKLSNLAIAHFNQAMIQQHADYEDYSFQMRFCEILNIPVPAQTEREWRNQNASRSKQSATRRCADYRIKQARFKRKRREDKAADKKQRDQEIKDAKKGKKVIGTYISGGDTSSKAARYGTTASVIKPKPKKTKSKAPCSKCKVQIPSGRNRICDICRAPK
jgi:hypothetical protein